MIYHSIYIAEFCVVSCSSIDAYAMTVYIHGKGRDM